MVLVTGGTGFLGRHVVRQLVEAEHEVRVLARSFDASIARDGVAFEEGSVLDRGTVRRAAQGADVIVHLAGQVSRSPGAMHALRRLHVDGTRVVVEEGYDAGVQRIVYGSTSGTIAVSRDPRVLTTEQASYPDELVRDWPYYQTKLEAEKLALERSAALGIPLVCLNPSLLLGPGDVRGSSTGDVARIISRRFPALPTGGLNFVDVRDAAAAFVAALEDGTPGERYLVGDHNWTLERFVRFTALLAGVKPPALRVPRYGMSGLARAMYRGLGERAPLDPVSLAMSRVFWYCDSSKAQRELGLRSRPAEDTLKMTIEWLRRSGAR